MNIKQMLDVGLSLRLFDGAAAAPAAGGTGEAGAAGGKGFANAAEPTAETKAAAETPASRAAGKHNKSALAAVKYGKQQEEAAPASTDESAKAQPETAAKSEAVAEAKATDPASMEAEFDRMIKGDFKDAFTKRFQSEFDARFKTHKQNEAQLKALQPILSALGSRLGVDPSDVAAMTKAVEADDSFYENEAINKGITVDRLKYEKKLESENAELKRIEDDRKRKENSDLLYRRWVAEAEQCKLQYPNFDLRAESAAPETKETFLRELTAGKDVKTAYEEAHKDEWRWQAEAEKLKQAYPGFNLRTEQTAQGTGQEFMRLLKAKIPVRTAFEVVHKDELLSGTVKYVQAATQKNVMETIKARGLRADENGSSGSAAAMAVKTDPKTFTKADRREILRRAGRGENIVL